jgi:hypothetical protein
MQYTGASRKNLLNRTAGRLAPYPPYNRKVVPLIWLCRCQSRRHARADAVIADVARVLRIQQVTVESAVERARSGKLFAERGYDCRVAGKRQATRQQERLRRVKERIVCAGSSEIGKTLTVEQFSSAQAVTRLFQQRLHLSSHTVTPSRRTLRKNGLRS